MILYPYLTEKSSHYIVGLYKKDSKGISWENGTYFCNMFNANDLWVSINCFGKLISQANVQNDVKFRQNCGLEASSVLNCTS